MDMTDLRTQHIADQIEGFIKEASERFPPDLNGLAFVAVTEAVSLAHGHGTDNEERTLNALGNLLRLGQHIAELASESDDRNVVFDWVRMWNIYPDGEEAS